MKFKKGLAFLISVSTVLSVMPVTIWADMPKHNSIIVQKSNIIQMKNTRTDENYAKIQNLPLHVIYPETKTLTVNELSSVPRIFVFGDIAHCPNTFYMMEFLTKQLKETEVEIYCLDVKDRSAEEILAKKEELPNNVSYFLCEDKDNHYNRMMWNLLGSGTGSITMPTILIIGKENETLYLNSFPSSAKYPSYAEELKNLILNAYPEESQDDTGNSTENLSSGGVKGTWTLTEDGQWEFTDNSGIKYNNTWALIEHSSEDLSSGQSSADWFRFDENGKMVIGWYMDPASGFWYYLNPAVENTLGRMLTGWCFIEGSYYYFSEGADGYRGRLYSNEQTPDGYFVDAGGKWIG